MIPAGETWYADESDMATVNGLTSITVSGAVTGENPVDAATLVFRQASPGAPGNPVSLGKGVTFRLEPTTNAVGHISSISTVDDSATLRIGSGLTLQLDAAPTNDVLAGAGCSVSTLLANWMPSYGEYVKAGPMSSGGYTVQVTDSVEASTVEVRQGTTKYYVRPLANGAVDLSSMNGVIDPLQGTAFLTAVNGGSYLNVPSNVTVQAGSGVAASVTAAATSVNAALLSFPCAFIRKTNTTTQTASIHLTARRTVTCVLTACCFLLFFPVDLLTSLLSPFPRKPARSMRVFCFLIC